VDRGVSEGFLVVFSFLIFSPHLKEECNKKKEFFEKKYEVLSLMDIFNT